MKLQYRALEGINTKSRRLAYLTVILLILDHSSLSAPLLLKKLTIWSLEHHADLLHYHVPTGEITSTQKNSSSIHYLDLAAKLKLIVPLSGIYQITRTGSVLFALIKSYEQKPNPFFLNAAEKIFYIYCLLQADADILLTLVDNLLTQQELTLGSLQQIFQENFLERLNTKLRSVQNEVLRMQIRDRQLKIKQWRHVKRYVEHIVPPRLNWLLDLGFLENSVFRHHRLQFTETGRLFFSSLPCFSEDPCVHDVSDQWLNFEYWQAIAEVLLPFKSLAQWTEVLNKEQHMERLLVEAFNVFHYSLVPRISLTQIMLYLSIRLLLDKQIIASPAALTEWFLTARVINGLRYEVRLSPRENESYIIIL